MQKTINWDNKQKELQITTWKNFGRWAFPFGVYFFFPNGDNLNIQILKWTGEIAIEFLCFGISFEFYSWRKK